MKYRRCLEAFYGTPLAILPEKLETIRQFLNLRIQGELIPDDDIGAVVAGRRADGVQMNGRVAVMSVFGTLAQRIGGMERASGGVSAEEIGQTLETLVGDKQVRCIVMQFDSPGGSVFGIPELGAKIQSLRDEKKIYGMADPMAASAAYWLASQCSELAVCPSGQVGSVGVLAAHQDTSAMNEAMGIKTTYVQAGKYKTELASEFPLSDEAKAELQNKVDVYYGMFVDAVAQGRGTTVARVKADFGQGRMKGAKEAVSAGMADRVETMAHLLTRVGADSGPRAEAIPAGAVAARARAVELGL